MSAGPFVRRRSEERGTLAPRRGRTGTGLSALYRGYGTPGAGLAIGELIVRGLLKLLLGAIEGQAIIVRLDVAHLHRDVLAANPDEAADADDDSGNAAVPIEDEILDVAELLVVPVVDVGADDFARPHLVGPDHIAARRVGR